MPKPTKRHVVTGISVLYLLALTALATYSLHQTTTYRLPISNLLCALTIALPPLAGLSTEALLSLQYARRGQRNAQRSSQSFLLILAIGAVFLVGETTLATLAGTHLGPASALQCGLQERWRGLWQSKDGQAIQRIQDAFKCCGFVTVKDMPFPFPDKDHGVETCAVRYERSQACLGPLMGLERRVAGLGVGVVAGVFVWQLALFLVHYLQASAASSDNNASWLPSGVRLPPESPARPRPAIGYRDVEETGEDDSLAEEVGRLNSDSNLASRVESGRGARARNALMEEHENWRTEQPL